jgi:hypothetical protein
MSKFHVENVDFVYRVAQAYLNEKVSSVLFIYLRVFLISELQKLDAEMRALTQNANQFAKQTGAWLSLVDNFNTALKELGHVSR